MSLRRTISWSTAMHDRRRDRVAPSTGKSPMFLASLERAREIDARRAERRAALEAERQAAYLAERLADLSGESAHEG